MLFCDFIFDDSKKMIVTDQVGGINHLVRSNVRKGNAHTVDLSVMAPMKLVQLLVTAYEVFYENKVAGKLISRDMQSMLMTLILERGNYAFVPDASKEIRTAEEILRVLGQVRMNHPTEAFLQKEDGKLGELKTLLAQYEECLQNRGEYDEYLLLKKASEILEKISKMQNSDQVICFLLPDLRDTKVAVCLFGQRSALETEVLSGILKLASVSTVEVEGIMEANGAPMQITAGQAKSEACDDKVPEVATAGGETVSFVRSYGASNEVAFVGETIRNRQLPYGDVAVIYSADVYENLLRGEFDQYKIPYSFPGGMKMAGSDFVQLMISFLKFARSDFDYSVLEEVINNPAFVLKNAKSCFRTVNNAGIGWKYERYEQFFARKDEYLEKRFLYETENLEEYLEFLHRLIECFAPGKKCEAVYDGILRLARDYTSSQNAERALLRETLNKKRRVFSLVEKTDLEANINLILDYLRRLKISTSAATDRVAVYPYGAVEAIDRKYLFVIGLSNEDVARTIAESPVLNDAELVCYTQGSPVLARERNMRERIAFEQTLAMSSYQQVWFGYSGYDTVERLQNSPSLVYLDLLAKCGKTTDDVLQVGYRIMNQSIRVSDVIPEEAQKKEEVEVQEKALTEAQGLTQGEGKASSSDKSQDQKCAEMQASENAESQNPKDVEMQESKNTEETAKDPLDLLPRFSASSLQTLLRCPFQYYYSAIRGIQTIEYQERVADRWLAAAPRGDLIHHVLDKYVKDGVIKNGVTKTDQVLLKKLFDEEVADQILLHPVPSGGILDAEAAVYFSAILRMVDKLHSDIASAGNGRQIIGSEIRFEKCRYDGGGIFEDEETGKKTDQRYSICFKGSVDRMDGYVDGDTLHLLIFDYKSGSVSNKAYEIEEGLQIQHYVYAYAMLEWAQKDENRQKLDAQFGCKIEHVVVDSVFYVFPMEDPITEVEGPISKEDPNDPGNYLPGPVSEVVLPEETDGMLMLIKDCIAEKALVDPAETLFEDYIASKLREAALLKEDYCRYCSYKKVCRMVP